MKKAKVLIILLSLLGISLCLIGNQQQTANVKEKGQQVDLLLNVEDQAMIDLFYENKESFEQVQQFISEQQLVENVAFFDQSDTLEIRTENQALKTIIENHDPLLATIAGLFDSGVSYISFNSLQDKLSFSLQKAPVNYRRAIVYHFAKAKATSFDQLIESNWYLNLVPNT